MLRVRSDIYTDTEKNINNTMSKIKYKNTLPSGIQCCIKTCKKSRRDTKGLKMFKVPPADKILGKIWRKNCKISEEDSEKKLYVCEYHFSSTDVGRRKLKAEAVPTINLSETEDDLEDNDSESDRSFEMKFWEDVEAPSCANSDEQMHQTSFQRNECSMAKLDEKIGFIGGGNMAFAIGSGLINQGIVKAGQVLVSGPNLENLQRWRDIGVTTTEDNNVVVDKSDIIFICVKPHILTPCAIQLKNNHVRSTKDKDKLFVSVLAGVNLKDLEEAFSFIDCLKMIRTMPNTPMQVGEGCTVYSAGSYIVQQDLEKVHLMLNSLGIAQQVPESMIDAVSGVSGCGPAFVYTIIEAMADGAVKNGVPRQMALQFATQTVLGAAKTVMITGKHPAVLRDEVCSPGGATIVGVHELEKGNLRSTLMNAVEKASQRATELGRKGK